MRKPKPDLYLLPHPATLPFSIDRVEFLLDVLARFICTPNAAVDPAGHYRATYLSAARRLAETFPNFSWESNYKDLAARLLTTGTAPKNATADELLLATLAAYGWASDRYKSKAEAIATAEEVLELYRNRLPKPLSSRSPTAVTA